MNGTLVRCLKVEILSGKCFWFLKYAFSKKEDWEWLASLVPNQWCVSIVWSKYWFGGLICQNVGLRKSSMAICFWLCLQWAEGKCELLALAKPVAANIFGNPPQPGCLMGDQLQGSSLWRPWCFLCLTKEAKVCLDGCEIRGNKAGLFRSVAQVVKTGRALGWDDFS